MVQSILLTPPASGDAWWRRPDALRAFAYALFGRADPQLAADFHAAPDLRPFTVAVLEEAPDVVLRLTALDASSRQALLRGCLEEGEPLAFGSTRLRAMGYAADAPPLAECATYAALAQTPFRAHVALEFVTPTAFSQGGDRHLPLPVPELLLRSWARRWNQFAPPELAIAEELLARTITRVGLADAQVATRTVHLHRGKLVGFTGTATLEALRPHTWDDGERAVFAALTAYSAYAGTGVRTTQGCGLTLPRHER
jgi:hypothetical protein